METSMRDEQSVLVCIGEMVRSTNFNLLSNSLDLCMYVQLEYLFGWLYKRCKFVKVPG